MNDGLAGNPLAGIDNDFKKENKQEQAAFGLNCLMPTKASNTRLHM